MNANFFFNYPITVVVLVLSIFISSCSRDDGPPAPPIPEPEPATVKFSSTSLNIEENATAALTIDLSFSKALREAGTVTISLDDASTASTSDYFTTPSLSEGTIILNLPEDANAASFSVAPVDNMELNEDKTIVFNISAVEGGVELADSDLTLIITITDDDEEDGGGEPSGELIFNDNFDYGTAPGDLTAVSSWERYSGELNPIQYIVDGLSFEGYGSSAMGGAITFEGGEGSREDVQIQFDSQNSGTIYLAQIINISSAEATESGDFFLSLRDPDDGYFNRLYFKDSGSGKLLLGTARTRSGGGSEVFSATEYSYDTNYLVILKYDFDTKLASMFIIGDSIPATEPAIPDVVAETGAEPASLEEIVIRQAGTEIVGTIDGIRVGTSWEDALGLE